MTKVYYIPGWELDGRFFCDQRSVSMTTTTPPADYRWTSKTATDYQNNPPTNPTDQEVWKSMRLAFLEKYTLVVSEEGKYRIWRWLDGPSEGPSAFEGRLVVWHERRLLSEPLPLVPGLWPADS
jgi:hypothetical protein